MLPIGEDQGEVMQMTNGVLGPCTSCLWLQLSASAGLSHRIVEASDCHLGAAG